MTDRSLEERLRRLRVPDEKGAEERSWRVIRTAHAERTPIRPAYPVRRLAVAVAASVVLLAVALSPAGAEVVDVFRDAIGIGEDEATPALRSLPTAGELLVESEAGPWVVREDGSKRLLGDYGEATWSPRGLFVAAADDRQLVAVDPEGEVRWSVTAPAPVRDPRWSPSGFRIAYRSGGDLRVVAGDGTGDRAVARDVAPVAPAWRPVPDAKLAAAGGAPGTEQLSFVDRAGRPRLVDVDSDAEISGGPRASIVPERYGPIREIAWSANGVRFMAMSERALVTDRFGPAKSGFFAYVATRGAELRDGSLAPNGEELAALERTAGRSEIHLFKLSGGKRSRSGPLFAGPGAITAVTWSPDGRWLLAGWRDADQWLFIRADRPRRLVAVDDVSRQFDPGDTGGGAMPRIDGWVLPGR